MRLYSLLHGVHSLVCSACCIYNVDMHIRLSLCVRTSNLSVSMECQQWIHTTSIATF